MLKFEEYLQQFTNTINLYDFVVGMLTTAILASIIRLFYIKYGDAIANRRRFANNFLPLALATMLIITIVKSSIALSLGLVGALSIVRFRAAIKDPEELTYLFLIIGLGLATGANHYIIAFIAIPAILLMLWIHKTLSGKKAFRSGNRMYLSVESTGIHAKEITALVTEKLSGVELKRMDSSTDKTLLSFLISADSPDQLNELSNQLIDTFPGTKVSFVEQPELIG